MALGMTKDSMVDLQSLAQEKNEESNTSEGQEDTVNLLMTGMSRDSVLFNKKLPEADAKRDISNEEDFCRPAMELEEPTKPKDPMRGESSTADGSPVSSGPQRAESEDFQDAEEEKKQDPMTTTTTTTTTTPPPKTIDQYAGFASDYDTYNYDAYQHFQYHQHPQTVLGGPKQRQGGWLCCLFPWFFGGNNPNSRIEGGEYDDNTSGPGQEFEQKAKDRSPKAAKRSSSSGEDDDDDDEEGSTASVGSEGLGERLSDKDRQALLARLRLAQPDKAAAPSSPDRKSSSESGDRADSTPDTPGKEKIQSKGLLNEFPQPPMNDKSDRSQSDGKPKGILKRQSTMVKFPKTQNDGEGGHRRSLFPTYDTNALKKNDNAVQFAPMARVVTVKSQKDMTGEEKSAIWWQRWDYEDFRKTGRIITKAMLEGGSEIWLASNKSWQHNGMSKSGTLKNAISLSERSAKHVKKNESSSDEETADIIETTGDKWWHKFGHSRRGLEHIASIKEGSDRQANVRHAIRAVLDEQRRQRVYMRQEQEKLRMISLHNTSWARDLALAAGASDADAVKSNFDEERKSREFYLLKMARSNSTTSRGKHVPAFMQPAMNTFPQTQLDANTSAQLKFRRKQVEQLHRKESAAPAPKKDKPPTTARKSLEPIHDPESSDNGKDLAKRAAGFSHDGAEEVNMAAVLSGMGAVPKKAQAVGAH